MNKKSLPFLVMAMVASVALFAVSSFADPVDTLFLTPPNVGHSLGAGAGGTRGDYVTMTGNFNLMHIGIQGEIAVGAQLTFNAYVFTGDGSMQLAVGPDMTFTGDGTEQFYNLPISFTLQAGQSYDIGIDFHSFSDPNWQVEYYFFDAGGNPPFQVGAFTVTDGEESHCGSCNVFAPNLVVDNVPEPGSLALLGMGLLGIIGVLRRKLF